MTIANFGFNFGCRPDAYITDAFCESIRLALCSGAAPVPLLSPIDGTACPAVAAPLEVECRGAFAALGFSEFYPALCARSDSVHGRSAWQFSARHHHPRSPPLAALPHPVREHPSCSLSRPLPLRLHLYFQARWEFSCLREFGLGSLAFQQQSSLILLLRSSQQLQIVLNHPGSMLVQKLALRVLVSANAPGMPAASALSLLSSGRCALHKQGGTLPPSRERSHIQELRAHTRALRRALGALERTRVQLRVDVATPAWLLLAEPGNASSEAVVVRSKRLVASVALSRQRCTVGRAASAELNTELHSYAAAFELVRLHGWLLSCSQLPRGLCSRSNVQLKNSVRCWTRGSRWHPRGGKVPVLNCCHGRHCRLLCLAPSRGCGYRCDSRAPHCGSSVIRLDAKAAPRVVLRAFWAARKFPRCIGNGEPRAAGRRRCLQLTLQGPESQR